MQESLLELLNKNLIYQVKEDEELGNIVTNSLAKSLASLEGDEYCKVAAKVLPLNHCLVDIERACCYCNDLLLIQLFETYYKLGKLLQLFQSILCHYSPFVSLGKDSRSVEFDIVSSIIISLLLCMTIDRFRDYRVRNILLIIDPLINNSRQ